MEEKYYKSLEILQTPHSSVAHLLLNNPTHYNALTQAFFTEFPEALSSLDQNPNVRVIILSGRGTHFCSGIDVKTIGSISNTTSTTDHGRLRESIRREIKRLQAAITAIETCRKPVISAVHGACVGGGIDIVTACDVRFCTEDAFFSVMEVDLGLAADLGTLQRLPSIVGFGVASELALTGRRFSGSEALGFRLVSKVFGSKEDMDEGVRAIAEGIAAKSPLAVSGTKEVLRRSRDMTIDAGLDYVATWNSAQLLSDDLTEAISARRQKRKPVFAKL